MLPRSEGRRQVGARFIQMSTAPVARLAQCDQHAVPASTPYFLAASERLVSRRNRRTRVECQSRYICGKATAQHPLVEGGHLSGLHRFSDLMTADINHIHN